MQDSKQINSNTTLIKFNLGRPTKLTKLRVMREMLFDTEMVVSLAVTFRCRACRAISRKCRHNAMRLLMASSDALVRQLQSSEVSISPTRMVSATPMMTSFSRVHLPNKMGITLECLGRANTKQKLRVTTLTCSVRRITRTRPRLRQSFATLLSCHRQEAAKRVSARNCSTMAAFRPQLQMEAVPSN